MTRPALAVLAVLLAPTLALADPPPLDQLLEQRVSEELATDGTILARLGVALDVESVGDHLIVSLVDPVTRRAVASTKVDSVPADREAAIATVTHVAANLAAQLSASGTAATQTLIDRDRDERSRRDSAETAYRKSALSFGDELLVSHDGDSTRTARRWVAYQGDLHRRLDPEQFYSVVGRPDLGAEYRTRMRRGYTAAIVGLGLVAAGGIYAMSVMVGHDDCKPEDPRFGDCIDAEGRDIGRTMIVGLGISVLGVIAGGVGAYYIYSAHPISEGAAQALGEQYNTNLRKQHGLPTGTAKRDVRLAPYAAAGGGGLVLGGRF